MRIQNGSFAVTSNNYSYARREAKTSNNAQSAVKTNKPAGQNTNNLSVSVNTQFDKMIENIQEQIQKVRENDRYDDDTKKSKIEELENQLKEIEKAKAEQLKESVLGKKNKSEGDEPSKNDKGNNSGNGVILDLSINAKALLAADNSLKSLKNTHSLKVKLLKANRMFLRRK